jgi:hypothetical protein
MANEVIIVENSGKAKGFTVADGITIPKNTIMELIDPRTASANDGVGDVIAGISAMEKVANDGSTEISVWTDCIIDAVVASGASVAVGEYVSTSGANVIKTATEAEIAAGKALGKALETGSDSERIEVRVLL